MKQVIRRGLKAIAIEELSDPIAPPHHVLIRSHYSLISSGTETAGIHTDGVLREVARNPSHLRTVWEALKEHGPARTTAEVRAKFSEFDVLGYSGAGVVVEKHSTVSDLEVGARVAYGGEGTGHAETILAGRNLVARLPDNVTFDQACFSTLGAIAMNSVRIAAVSLGETVAVIGLGLVGQLIAQLARLQGARVIAIDLLQDRVDMAQKLGSHYGLLGDSAAGQMVTELTNGLGVDCVIIAAATKSSAPCYQAIDICRDRGRIIVTGAVDMSFPREDMYLKEIQLFMSRAYGPGSYDPTYERRGQDYPVSYVRWTENRNMEEFLRLVGSGEVQVSPLISHRFPLDQAPEAYRTIMEPATSSLAVVLQYPATELPVTPFQGNHKIAILPAQCKSGSIGVGLIGSGNLARWQHLPNINKSPHCKLIGVHSSNPVRGKSYATRFRADYGTTDERALLDDPNVDAIVIVSRNEHHGRQVIDALRAGKHVFVEKPMALTVEDCREIYQAVQETGKVLTVGFNRRFAPYYLAVKDQLKNRSGPAVINCRVNSPGISGDYWMVDPASGRAILGEACHFVDLMCWLLDTEPVSVSAHSLPREKQDPVGEHNLVAIFEFADGSIASLAYCTIGSKTSGGERIEVFAQGVAAITENFNRLVVKKGIVRTARYPWARKGYRAQMEDFVEAIQTGREPEVTVRDGVRATVLCLRMLESASTGLPCAIDVDQVCGVTSKL